MKKEAMLYEKLRNKRVHCFLCAHECKIAESGFGICGVRQNIEGTLFTIVYARAISANIDPIEKKPLFGVIDYHCAIRSGSDYSFHLQDQIKLIAVKIFSGEHSGYFGRYVRVES